MRQIITLNINNPNRLRESYILNNHPELYNLITEYIDIDMPFKEKMWYYYNDIKQLIFCDCGNTTKFNKKFTDGFKKYCSVRCSQISIKTKEKRKQTNLKKYGVDNIAKNDLIKKKKEATNLEKYGYKSSFSNKEVQKKWKRSIKAKYGTEHIFMDEGIKSKIRNTMNQRYGDHYTKTQYYKDDLEIMNFKELIRKKRLDKHKKFFEEHGYEFLKIEEYKKFTLKKGDDIFDILWDTFINRLEHGYEISTNKNPLYFTGKSKSESELVEWINGFVNIETSNRDILKGKELDIYIPDYNLAIEFNGLYWHSELNKVKNYHINKSKICKQNGIHLLHIWEDDWIYKKVIIKSIILNKLMKIPTKIYARKCIIREVKLSESKIFLNDNHIQGYSNSTKRYGLYYNDELVSLMTFGYRYISGIKTYELIRFCNKINTSVIGASSKLFKYFLKNNNTTEIVSYSDISLFDGGMYEALGFIEDSYTSLNYWWVVDKKRYHRFTYNKKRLIREGADPNLSEKEIMYNRGSYRIWGCGQIRWLYTN